MILRLRERLIILGLLPVEGDILTLRTIRQLKDVLPPSVKEIDDLNIVQETNRIIWADEKDKGIEIDINVQARGIIKDALQKVSDEKKLKDEMLTLWDMFIEDDENNKAKAPASKGRAN